MLIVAAPKTASTSLLKTLEKLHEIPGQQLALPDREWPAGYRVLPRYHGDPEEIVDVYFRGAHTGAHSKLQVQ
ncbi:MAG: hypothetical protein PVI30_10855 [Myxococcales bacterium]|jgi:hypothetical protein